MQKIAVVGAGIFGCVAALELQKIGANVHLYDVQSDIMQCASRINQYRLHSGYHYPRSKETARSSQEGLKSFMEEFQFSVVPSGWITHHYAIPSEGSKINVEEYFRFLFECKLPFRVLNGADWIFNDRIDLLIKVNEQLFDYNRLKEEISRRILNSSIIHKSRTQIICKLGTQFTRRMLGEYDIVINAAYANLNELLPEDQRVEYQFEIIEKPIVLLPHEWRRRSLVLIDGPFFCLDPYGYSNSHVMGHVEYAIHHSNVGRFPEIPPELESYLNSGIIYRRPITNFSKFKEHAEQYLPIKIDTIGSLYTIRTVLPGRDADDARPSYITKHSDRLYSIFSGKIGTCVEIARGLSQMIKK